MVKTRHGTYAEVNTILESIKKPKKDVIKAPEEPKEVNEPIVESKPIVEKKTEQDVDERKQLPFVPRGKPKSGKIWKNKKERFSSIVKTKGIRNSFAEKTALRISLKAMKETSRALQEQKKQEKEANKERRRLNIKRTEENRLKSEIVQVISNSAKVKRMKKKQLRFIEKRDTSQIVK